MTAPRPSFIKLATGIVADPSTIFTVTGMRMTISRLRAAGASSGALRASAAAGRRWAGPSVAASSPGSGVSSAAYSSSMDFGGD
jgi:hypothetical protein